MKIYVGQQVRVRTNKWGFTKNDVVTIISVEKKKKHKEFWITVLTAKGVQKEVPKKYIRPIK